MAPRRKQQWKIGDVFVVRNADGKYTLGQIVGREAEVLNSVTVAFYDAVLDRPDQEIAHTYLDRLLVSPAKKPTTAS